MNRDAINVRVRPSKVNVLKHVGRVRAPLDNLAEARRTALLDEDGLAGEDVDDVGEAQLAEGDGLGGHEVVGGALEGGGGPRAEAERADAVGVAEAEDAVAGDHGGAGERAVALGVDVAEGGEDVLDVGAGLAQLVQRVREDVEAGGNTLAMRNLTASWREGRERNVQELRIRLRVDVAAGLLVEEGAEVVGVDQVPVDADAEAEGGVDVEGLGLRAVEARRVRLAGVMT